MNASEKRMAVRDKYRTILGRNKYSQAKRSYVNTKYKDGNYYSDCSSSVSWAYKAAGVPISYGGTTLPNTVGLYNSKDLADVPVAISKGQITNPEVLRVGDLLLFAGDKAERKSSGYVGHVEMVASINGSKITIYGHGSGTPRETEMTAYLKKRYGQKTSKTSLGHKGLIKVRRRIPDDGSEPMALPAGPRVTIANCKECNIRTGPGTQYESVGTCKCGESFAPAENPDGWVPVVYDGAARWVSGKYARREPPEEATSESKSIDLPSVAAAQAQPVTGPTKREPPEEATSESKSIDLPSVAAAQAQPVTGPTKRVG